MRRQVPRSGTSFNVAVAALPRGEREAGRGSISMSTVKKVDAGMHAVGEDVIEEVAPTTTLSPEDGRGGRGRR